MPCRPRQHGAGNPKIIMPPAHTVIEVTSVFIHDFELSQLLISPAAHLIIHYPHVTAFHFGQIVLNQSGATDGIDPNDPARHLPALKVRSLAMPPPEKFAAGLLRTNHAHFVPAICCDGVARGPQSWVKVDEVRKFHYLRDKCKAGAMSNRRQPWDLQQL